MSALNDALLAAHARHDTGALIKLYTQAAEAAQTADSAAFYLTHAYVFALEAGHGDTAALRQRLIDAGREQPLLPANPPKR